MSFQAGLPQTSTDLANYCLRKLGAPVINIDLAPEQIQDRVTDSLNFAAMYLWDLTEEMYFPYQIQPATLTLNAPVSSFVTLMPNTTEVQITSQTSNIIATCKTNSVSGNVLQTVSVAPALKNFVVGETVTFSNGATGTITAYTAGDVQNGYIAMPQAVVGVTKVLSMTGGYNSSDIFNIQYQLRLNDLFNLSSVDLGYYKMAMQYLDLLDIELNGHVRFRYNRFTQQMHLDINWQYDVVPGQFIVVQGYTYIDPDQYASAYGDPYLIDLTTAKLKKQWGANLKKFSGVPMPGGVTFNGQAIYDEAVKEELDIEEKIMKRLNPLGFLIG